MADINSSSGSEAYSSSDSIGGSEENIAIASQTGDDIVEEQGDIINGEDLPGHDQDDDMQQQESAEESLPEQNGAHQDTDIDEDDGHNPQPTLQDVEEKNQEQVQDQSNQAAYVSYTVDDSGKGNDHQIRHDGSK